MYSRIQPVEIMPEQYYSAAYAARYLGVHRCTIYDYIKNPERPLRYFRSPDERRLLFRGTDLIAYKEAGLPKKGRKNKAENQSHPSPFNSGETTEG